MKEKTRKEVNVKFKNKQDQNNLLSKKSLKNGQNLMI